MKLEIDKIKELRKKSDALKAKAAKESSEVESEILELTKKLENSLKKAKNERNVLLVLKKELNKKHEEFISSLKINGLTLVDGEVKVSNNPTIEYVSELISAFDTTLDLVVLYAHEGIMSGDHIYWYRLQDTYSSLDQKEIGRLHDISKEKGDGYIVNQTKEAYELICDTFGECNETYNNEYDHGDGGYEHDLNFSFGEFELSIHLSVDGREGYDIVYVSPVKETTDGFSLF